MASFTALYDANVLYPAPLRDFLMQLAMTNLFRAKWSQKIHEEWMQGVLRDRPEIPRERLNRTRDLMDQHVLDALVFDFESLIDGLELPDPDDRHVLAAAIKGRADVIVTRNTKDFPREILHPFGIEAQHPDVFIVHLIDLTPGVVAGAVREHRERLKNPPKSVDEYLSTLEQQGLTQTVMELRSFASVI